MTKPNAKRDEMAVEYALSFGPFHPGLVQFETNRIKIHFQAGYDSRDKEVAELKAEITMFRVGNAHTKSERQTHDEEQEVFVKEAADKINELKAEVEKLKEYKWMYEELCK